MEKLPFIPEQLYKRSEIHDQYGGNRQGGISPSAKHPYIFIFSGKTGEQYGYKDGWDNTNIFSYTGEGQIGDMKFIKGNLALRDHVSKGKRVFLFEYERLGFVKFVSELEFFDVDYFETPDINKVNRIGIKFFFKRKGAYIPITPQQFVVKEFEKDESGICDIIMPTKTERSGLVTSRIGQGAYRKRVIHRWQYQCAVTKFDKIEILIASHIVPWSKATNEERLDVHNGILLSPNYDALFDKHFITFSSQGKIVLSDKIEKAAFEKIGVTGQEKIEGFSRYNLSYLERHNEIFSL
jgi:5-methylcytosine-specific restriction protein A